MQSKAFLFSKSIL